jgi:hypothetical protein
MSSSDVLDKVENDIDEHGWHVLSVFGEDAPSFSYSIGFTETLDHPEVLMSGLDTKLMHNLINDIGNLIKQGHSFSANDLSNKVLNGFPVKFIAVTNENKEEYFRAACSIYGEEEFVALQCLWPDKNGVFPENSSKSQEVLA